MNKFMIILSVIVALPIFVRHAEADPREGPALYDPYERPKNGPPLTNVFRKARPEWIFSKLRKPGHHPAARMPDFEFDKEEALDIMAYLKSIGSDMPPPPMAWPAWADKSLDDLDDDEITAAFDLADRGKAVWSNARCSICHAINGPGGRLIGGFVDLRVGGIDLQIAGTKLNRDWLYRWIKNPRAYFPNTLMPRFRFSDDDLRGLTEYILRDDAFIPFEEEEGDTPERQALGEKARATRGKRLIEMSRCVVCHEIDGIADIIKQPEPVKPPPPGSFQYLAYDLRCLSCHSIGGRGGTYAPDLTSEGSRLHGDWIADFVESPDMIRPLSQQMPKFNLTREEARTIAAYMSGERLDDRIPESIPGEPVTAEEIESGREIYQAKGCFACHSTGEGPGGVVGPALDAAGDRLKPGYIWYHLTNPHAVNPYSPEPDYGLTEGEARSLAAYLASRKK